MPFINIYKSLDLSHTHININEKNHLHTGHIGIKSSHDTREYIRMREQKEILC